MTPEFGYALAFTAGLLGSGHCIGMCGALVSGFFMRAGSRSAAYPAYLAYHGARISVYALAGAVAAFAGAALISTGLLGRMQGLLQIVVGVLVILLALEMLGVLPWRTSIGFLPQRLLRRGFSNATDRGPMTGAALGGAVNGLMPCPLTLSMAVNATAAASPWEGGLLLFVFGLGTLPSMVFVSFVFGKWGSRARGYLLKAAALVVLAMGLNTLYHGVLVEMRGAQIHASPVPGMHPAGTGGR